MSDGELLYAQQQQQQQQQYALQQQAAQHQQASQELASAVSGGGGGGGGGGGILQNQQQQALVALSQQQAHAQAVAHAQQQQERAAAAAAAFGTAMQQYPSSVPTTPLSHPSPRSSPIKATPDSSVGGSAGIGVDAGRSISNPVQASSPFSNANGIGGSVVSPSGSAFSSGTNEQAMQMAAEAATYGRATGMALAGATGMGGGSPVKGAMLVQAQSLGGMDLDLSSYGNGSITPGASSSGASFMYPPPVAGPQAHQNAQPPSHAAPSHPAPSMPSAPRHHPYAHASRPALHTQVSASSIPLYLSSPSPVGGPGPTTPPPYAGPDGMNNLSLGVPSKATSVAPQRVHSAPAHILTLSTQNLDQLSSPVGSAEPDSQGALDQRRFLVGEANHSLAPTAGSTGLHESTSDTTLHLSTASAPSTTPAPIPLQQQQSVTPAAAFQANRSAAMRIDTSAHASNVLSTLSAPQSAPPTAMEDMRMTHVGYNEKVSAAISLLQKRLPIMGAALSTSETESGQDEEEIWKGIEGAYDELKRIMVGRKDGRRRASLGSSAKRNFTTMELESPITPITPSDHVGHAYMSNSGGSGPTGAGLALSQMPAPPPLVHSLSTPDVSLAASTAAARQAAYAQAQAAQLQQQAQLQQAHMQAQANAEVEHRIKVEEEARQQHAEAETRARAEAAAEAEAMAQHQRAEQAMREAEQYQQALVHEEQLRLARERLHQQMQEGAAPGAPQILPNPPAPPPTPSPAASATMSQSSQPSPPSQQTSSTELTPQPPVPQQLAPIGFGGSASSYGQVAPHMMPAGSGPLLAVPTQAAPGAITPPLYSAGGPQSSSAGASTYQFTGGLDPASDQMAMQMHLNNLAAFQQQQAHQQQQAQQQQQQHQQQQQQAAGQQSMDSVDPSLTGGFAPSANSTLANSAGPGPIRQSRSRAASQSGYTSSGSRSRAASGSGYQVLLESRSRAASSASSVYPAYEKDEEGDDDDDPLELEHEIEVGGSGPAQSKLSQFSAVPPRLDQEMKARLDAIFLEYLADVCSNLDATDSKGEMIHQTLMAKKMEKLDQSADFRPFRFRIQAFTTAFAERAQASGLFDSEIPAKKIREYLWSQPYISRFNDDGKKAKSKGNHIWTIEAKKLPDRKWIFREFVRCIKGPAPSVGFVGLTWQWAPRVWDPQRSSDSIDASFMSPNLPDWLSWEDNVLSGVVPTSALGENYEIEAVATFQMGDRVHQLKASTRFFVASPEETEDPAAFAMLSAAGQSEPTCDAPRETLESRPVPSREASPLTSPPAAQASLYRSPSTGSSSAFESGSQSYSRLLPQFGSAGSSYAGSGLGTPGSALEASFAQLDPRQLHEREQQRFLAHLQQADGHDSSGSNSAGVGGATGEVQMQLQDEQPFAAAQAALHQHYSTAAMQQGISYEGIPAEQLSFAPPPELVQNALQDVIPVDSYTSLDSAMLSTSMAGGEDPFQLHVMGQQPPFATTIDPSTL